MSCISVTFGHVRSVFPDPSEQFDRHPWARFILADRIRCVITSTRRGGPGRAGLRNPQNAITGLSNPYNRTHQADLKGSEDRADWWHLAFGTGETG